jgi:anti-sigma regulatory factor (Ser/Thr protein kinase)
VTFVLGSLGAWRRWRELPACGWLNGVGLGLVTERAHSQGVELAESYPAVPDSVPRARQAVIELAIEAGANDEELDAIRLATSEALTNAVVHAYEGAPGQIHVQAKMGAGRLSVTVADDGRGLAPRLDRRGMGLGLALIADAAEELAIVKRPTGGTAVQMRFAVSLRR